MGTGRCDGLRDAGHFMSAEIVEDDDIARTQTGNQHLFDPSPEASTVDGSVHDQRGG